MLINQKTDMRKVFNQRHMEWPAHGERERERERAREREKSLRERVRVCVCVCVYVFGTCSGQGPSDKSLLNHVLSPRNSHVLLSLRLT